MSENNIESNNNSSAGFIAVILLLISAVGVVIEPITSSRPDDPELIRSARTTASSIESRLWQDPIALVENHNRSHSGDPGVIAENENAASLGLWSGELSKYKNISIFAISVPGSNYPEAAETRRRIRYAVTSTFDAVNFYPKDADTFGIYKSEKGMNLGFEWFDMEDHQSELSTALVIWLNEDQIRKSTDSYRNFIDHLNKEMQDVLRKNLLKNTVSDVHKDFDFFLIGPNKFSFFIDLLKKDPIGDGKFQVMSYFETATEEQILKKLRSDCGAHSHMWYCQQSLNFEELAEQFQKRHIIRSVGSDDKLVSALLIELWERGFNRDYFNFVSNSKKTFRIASQSQLADGQKCADGLVLIYEMDTFYASSLTSHFKENNFWKLCNGEGKDIPIRRFTYLRGIDGNLPLFEETHRAGSDNDSNEMKVKNTTMLSQWSDAAPEHSQGRNQFDYLRRLSASIGKLDLDKDFSSNGVKAIGIFGSDVYDKLIILQALRAEFKDKIFFTTDLDARFLHNDQLEWSRNLIVASNYDLTIPVCSDNSRQSDCGSQWERDPNMPFRDGYQTSIAVSIFFALKSGSDKKENDLASTINKYVKPRIFEIGRTQATLLGTENKDDPDKWIKCKIDEKHGGTSDKLCKEKTWRDMVNDLITGLFNPKDSTTSTKSEIQVLIKFLILVVFFGAMYIAVFILNKKTAFQLSSTSSNSLNNNDNWGIKQNIWYIILSVIVIALFFGFVLVDNFEPFMWLEGVSIWPNLAIRLVGVLVIMYFSNYFYFKLRYHKRIISRVYFPDSIEQKNLADKSKKELNPQMFFITNIWQSYLNATSPVKLTLAIFLFATLALVITFFIFQHFGQVNFPYRGGIVLGIHYALLWLQYIFLWGLVFWFYFEAIACINFINAANDSHCEWPVKVLDELESDTGISKTYLDRYTQFQVIAQVTEFVGRLIYLPFGMMLIILLERSKIIDQLGVPFSLILIFLTIAVISLYLMYKMRVSAEKARDNILKFYMLKSRKIEFSKEKDDIAEIQINRVIRLINNTQMGIYASVHHQPFAAALLIPFGGMGGMQIIENLFGIQ